MGRKPDPKVLARRRQVFELALAGINPAQISERLGVPLRTIHRDLAMFRKELAEKLKQYPWDAEIMSMWERTNRIIYRLEALYAQAERVEEKRRILRTIAELTVWQFKTLQYLGILEKEPVIAPTLIQNTQINLSSLVQHLPKEYHEVVKQWAEWKKAQLEKG